MDPVDFVSAVRRGDLESVKGALEAGFDPTQTTDANHTRGRETPATVDDNGAIVVACELDTRVRTDMALLLLGWTGSGPLEGKRVNPSVDRNVCLWNAAWFGDATLFNALLTWDGPEDHKPDPQSRDRGADQILDLLCSDECCPSASVAESMLDSALAWRGRGGKRVDLTASRHLLKNACVNNLASCVQKIFQWRGFGSDGHECPWVDPRKKRNEAFVEACKHAALDVMRVLREWRAPDGHGCVITHTLPRGWNSIGGVDYAPVMTMLLSWHPDGVF